MKSKKQSFSEQYFYHMLAIGIATSLTLVVISAFFMQANKMSSMESVVTSSPTQVEETQAAVRRFYPGPTLVPTDIQSYPKYPIATWSPQGVNHRMNK